MKSSIHLAMTLLLASLTARGQFDSGSTGADGALNVTNDTILNLPPNGIFNFTTITVVSNATLRFIRNSNNTPVYLLAAGNVNVMGTIDVSGSNAASTPLMPGAGGPGGFDGGWPGFDTVPAGYGYGPGGGKAGLDGQASFGGQSGSAGAGSYAFQAQSYGGGFSYGYQSTNKGATYGSQLLVPLIGGSGGGGTSGSPGIGGGGGGGAVLIASSIRIDFSGILRANGGEGQTYSSASQTQHINPGSGGAIRLVAPAVAGTGLLEAGGGSYTGNIAGNWGRARIDSIDRTGLNFSLGRVVYSIGNYMVVFPTTVPRLDLINVATTNIAEGSGPVTMLLPNGSSTNQPVTVQARDFNVSVPIQVAIAPQNGPTVIYTNTIFNAASNPASTTINVVVPVSTPVTVSSWSKVP